MSTLRRRRGDLAPSPELWAALDGGPRLRAILEDFYAQVYADPQLAPFFDGVTIERAIDKQYNFLVELITGERVYFGERPRNAHHWMVISDALFDHREALMEATLRRHGLAEPMIARWRAMEEVFRAQIVKAAPVPRKLRGQALPLDGFDSIVVAIGTLCDGCGGEIAPGGALGYHVRTGRGYCATCVPAAS